MEHFRRYVGVDDYVRIVLGDYLIFDGFIANPVIGSERGQAERVELTVIGKEVRLDDGIVAGLMVRTPVHDAEVLAGSTTETVVGTNTVEVDLPLIFNPNNRPNATARKATITRTNAIKVIEAEGPVRPTVEVRLFEDVEREHIRATAVYWTLAEAMKYIIYQYNDELYVANPEAEVIDNLFLDTPISNVDLTGTRNLFKEVLPKLLAGTRFSFMVSRNRLIFWDKERGRGEGFIHLDRPGTAITEAGASNVAGVVLGRNTLAAANEIEVQGDFQYVQGGFLYDSNDLGTRDRTADNGSDLIEAWKVQTAELDKYFDAEGNFLAAGDDEVLTTEFMGRFNTEGDQFNYGG